jgi:ribosomal protein L11 methylase PrmA
MIKLAKIKKGDKAVDLGSGDGRIVIALAKAGAEAHGYEINPFLVWYSRYKIKKAGLKGKAFIHRKSFWKINFKQFDVIMMFQFHTIMDKLKKKLKKELKPKARVVSYYWKFPKWKPNKKIDNIYLYKK